MRAWPRRSRILGLWAAAVAVAVLACGENGMGPNGDPDPDPDPDPVTGIRASVTVNGSAASGIVISVFASGGTTALATRTTQTDGTATFEDLAAGTYEVEVTVPAGMEVSGSSRVTSTVTAGAVSSVSFSLTAPEETVVEILATGGLQFSPEEVTVSAGTRVRWTNEVSMLHTVTPTGHSEWSEATLTAAGQTFEHVFTTPGDFPYHCVPHLPGMIGMVRVQ